MARSSSCPPPVTPGCLTGIQDVTLNPEDHDQTFALNAEYTKRFGADRSWFASLEPEYGTGYPVLFQNGPGRLNPHLTFDLAVGKTPKGNVPGFDVSWLNMTNYVYLIKVNNGFNTTQYAAGSQLTVRLTQPF